MPKKKKRKKKLKKSKKLEKIVTKKIAKEKNFKTSDEKVAIKKIKKQPIEKKIYNIKDHVVYPKHGVGKIISINKAKIGNIDITFYKVFIEKEKLTLSIPLNQQFHLRSVSSINQINKAISILKSKPKIKRTMWSRRAQEYEATINSGHLSELTEVVRDLFRNHANQPEQSYSERQLYEAARDRLAREVAVVENTDDEKAVEKIELILSEATQKSSIKENIEE